MAENNTLIKEEEIDLDELLNVSGDDVYLDENEKSTEAKNIFEKEKDNLDDVINNKGNTDTDTGEDEKEKELDIDDESLNEIIDVVENKDKTSIDTDAISLVKKLIEDGKLLPFDDGKDIDEYTVEDISELIDVNLAEKQKRLEEEVPMKFFDALPDKLKYAAKYVADGGEDLEGLFKVLAESESVAKLNPENENHAERIIKEYLYATNFGDEDEIQEEIDAWKDRGELTSKANKFKPKLDALKEIIAEKKVAEAEQKKKLREERAIAYEKDVLESLSKGKLNDIDIDEKTANKLAYGLTRPTHKSIKGNPTNLLGHLLEKYQVIEPNHGLVAEALWLLSDPEGYRSKLKGKGSIEQTEKIVRKLKTEESKKISSNNVIDDKKSTTIKRPTLKRPTGDFFNRR